MRVKRLAKNIPYVLQKPQLVGRIIKNYANIIFLRKQMLRSIQMDMGYECQLDCKHCYSHKMKRKDKKLLNVDEMKKIVDDSIELGALHFCLSGGEPLLYEKRLLELIRHIESRGRYSAMVTNAYALDDIMLEKLKDAGLKMMVVSIGSHDANKHDEHRGKKGSYAKAVKAVRTAKKMGFKVFINSVITSNNTTKKELDEMKEINRELGAETHVNLLAPIGKLSDREDILFDDEEQIKKILGEEDIHSCTDRNYFGTGCPAGKEKILITAYGDVMPCAMIQMSFGNLKKESLKEVLKKMQNDKCFGKYKGMCLPSSNKEFMSEYLTKIQSTDKLPLNICKNKGK